MLITPVKLVSYALLFLRIRFIFNGYAGGGVALLYASKALDKLQTANFDQKIGVQIIQNALKVWEKIIICLAVISFSIWEKIIICLAVVYFSCVLISENLADTSVHNCFQCRRRRGSGCW
jgi:hypothetical protein